MEGPFVKPVSGEGQRLGFGCSLLGDPQFLILDEPTGLDQVGSSGLRGSSVSRLI